MKITLIRHAEVEERYCNCYNGHIDIELSKKGLSDSILLAKSFLHANFDLVYCSDLIRAKATLQPFKQSSQAIYTDLLREKSWGKYEGKSFETIINEGEIEYENFIQWIDALGGEDYAIYTQRVSKFFLDFLLKQDAKSVLVVTHAGVIRTLISIVKKLSLEEAFTVSVPYGSAIVLDTHDMSFS